MSRKLNSRFLQKKNVVDDHILLVWDNGFKKEFNIDEIIGIHSVE